MAEQGLEARSLESLLEEVVGKGILVDPNLLWEGHEGQPGKDVGRIDLSTRTQQSG